MSDKSLRDKIGDVHPVQNYVPADEIMSIIRDHLTTPTTLNRLRASVHGSTGRMLSYTGALDAVQSLLSDDAK